MVKASYDPETDSLMIWLIDPKDDQTRTGLPYYPQLLVKGLSVKDIGNPTAIIDHEIQENEDRATGMGRILDIEIPNASLHYPIEELKKLPTEPELREAP